MIQSHQKNGRSRNRHRSQSFGRQLRFETLDDRLVFATFQLGQADVTIFGVDANDESGISVSNAGDVNGDGFDDLLIGARYGDAANNAKNAAGESYLVFGKASWSPTATIDLANLGSGGVTFYGADALDFSGRAVSSAGDINGDGFDDLLIGAVEASGANNARSRSGESYVIFGKADWSATPTVDLGSLGTAGVTIYGAEAFDLSGFAVSTAGDVNGDGYDDLLIGAHLADAANNARNAAGESYIVFGKADWSATPTIDLSNLGPAGVILYGANVGDDSGIGVSGAGDVNGDGFDDLLIGARYGDAGNNAKNAAGDSYLVFGKASWAATLTLDLANLGTDGVVFYGANVNDYSGLAVSGAGDVNGDGFDDVLIGAVGGDLADNATSNAGETYLVFGKANWSSTPTVDLANLGSAGVTFYGAEFQDNSGLGISGAGDINGDGFDDLLIGARYADGVFNSATSAGESYLVFGKRAWSPTFFLENIGSAGIMFFGVDVNDYSGFSLSNAGDLNGDGFDDLIIGAAQGDAAFNAKTNAGESYVVFGNDEFTASATHVGTAAAETLLGTPQADVMIGHRGDDVLVGAGGADVLRGGQGNDVLAVSDLNFQRLVGGNGTDTLRLDGTGMLLDLTTRADNRIQGIERIDVTGSGANTLTLTALEVLNLSDESNTLVVFRDIGDTVNRGSGWTRQSDEVFSGATFEVYTQGAAILKIQSNLADIALTMTASNDVVTAGGAFFYTAQVTNNGPSNATIVSVTDSIPVGLLFDPANSDGICSRSGEVVTCNLGSLAAAASRSVKIGMRVASSLAHGQTVSNTAVVSANVADPTPADHSATVSVTVNRQADLLVSSSASADPVAAGSVLNYSIGIDNRGPSDASGVILKNTLSAGLTFFPSGSTPSCTAVGQLVTCNVGSVAAGSTSSQQIRAVVSSSLAAGETITNTASIVSNEADPTPADHTSTLTVGVVRQANLSITKTASTDPVLAGGSFTYGLRVINAGPSLATGVTVTDTLPAGLTFDDANSSDACMAVGQEVTCTVGNVAPETELSQTLAVLVASSLANGAMISNTATVNGNEPDPSPNGQSSTVTVRVFSDPFPWQNPGNPLDVNNDQFVSPIDALQIINELNLPQYSGANGRLPVPPPPGHHSYYDVSGDNFVVPNDALIVINFLNAHAGEGEATSIPLGQRSPDSLVAVSSLFLERFAAITELPSARRPAERTTLPNWNANESRNDGSGRDGSTSAERIDFGNLEEHVDRSMESDSRVRLPSELEDAIDDFVSAVAVRWRTTMDGLLS